MGRSFWLLVVFFRFFGMNLLLLLAYGTLGSLHAILMQSSATVRISEKAVSGYPLDARNQP